MWCTWRSDFRTVLMCSAEDFCLGWLWMHCHEKDTPKSCKYSFGALAGLGKLISGQDPFHVCTKWNYLQARSAERERCSQVSACLSCISLSVSSENCHWQKPWTGGKWSGRDSRGLLFLGHIQTWVWDPSFWQPSVTASAGLPLFSNSKSLSETPAQTVAHPKAGHWDFHTGLASPRFLLALLWSGFAAAEGAWGQAEPCRTYPQLWQKSGHLFLQVQ